MPDWISSLIHRPHMAEEHLAAQARGENDQRAKDILLPQAPWSEHAELNRTISLHAADVPILSPSNQKESPMFSWAASFGSWFTRLWKKAPNWVTQAKSTLLYVAPLAVTVVSLVDADAGVEASDVVAKLQHGFAALGAALDAGGDGTSATQIIDGLLSTMDDLLKAGQIKNPDTLKKVETAVSLIGTQLKGILSLVPKTA